MIEIKLKDGKVIIVASSLYEAMEYNELIAKFADRSIRAVSVNLNSDYHSEKSKTILCDDIKEIIKR